MQARCLVPKLREDKSPASARIFNLCGHRTLYRFRVIDLHTIQVSTCTLVFYVFEFTLRLYLGPNSFSAKTQVISVKVCKNYRVLV
jgi:hypothetical protein